MARSDMQVCPSPPVLPEAHTSLLFALLDLRILIADPAHQRRGAGSLLVKWGCHKADEHGLMTVLTASEAGLRVYLKHGFKVVKETHLDLRPFGVDETEIRRNMIRQPVARVEPAA